jgi:hypothetical protein
MKPLLLLALALSGCGDGDFNLRHRRLEAMRECLARGGVPVNEPGKVNGWFGCEMPSAKWEAKR